MYVGRVGVKKMVGMVGRRTVVSATALMLALVAMMTFGWSSASDAFQIEVPNVVINEVHYEPSPGGVEFIELLNPTDDSIDISGMELDGVGEPFAMPDGTVLPAGATGILTADAAAFGAAYPGSSPSFVLEYPGSLDPEGELVQLALEDGTPVDSVPYLAEDPWPVQPNGQGPTLSLFDPELDNELSESWGISASNGGTPGAANDTIEAPVPAPPNLVVTEIRYSALGGEAEFIELFNGETFDVDLSGYALDGFLDFPDATVIEAQSYLVLTNDLGAFSSEFPNVAVLEWTGPDLPDVGASLVVQTDDGATVDDLAFEDGGDWPLLPGGGVAIELSDVAADNSDGSNWELSSPAAGSPGSDGPLVPPVPVDPLVSPIGETAETEPTFQWAESEGATAYRVWVNDRSNGGKYFDQILSVGPVGCTGGTCEADLGVTFVEGDSYRWWVQAQNSVGVASWSPAADFSLPSDAVVPGQVSLLAPSGADHAATPEFRWTHDAEATRYRLWVQSSSGDGVIDDSIHTVGVDVTCTAAECSLVLPGITFDDGVFQWWVQAQSDAGSGDWSSPLSFAVGQGTPDAATLIGPSGAGAGNTPTYSWDAVPGATWYYLWVNDDAGSATVLEWVRAVDAGCAAGEAICEYTSATPVNGSARWWIRTWNQLGFGPWSAGTNFTT